MPRWLPKFESLDAGRVLRLTIETDDIVMSAADVFAAWRDTAAFRDFFARLLAAIPFDAYFWEVRPVDIATLDDAFECIFAESPALQGVAADSQPFAAQLTEARAPDGVATFPNLGNDAVLVAPAARSDASHYAHLAVFARGAPTDQRHELLRRVALALDDRIGSAPLWLSTSGVGVYWLHVRLDTSPKYYTFAPYRQWP